MLLSGFMLDLAARLLVTIQKYQALGPPSAPPALPPSLPARPLPPPPGTGTMLPVMNQELPIIHKYIKMR